jgi:hypothetical protein
MSPGPANRPVSFKLHISGLFTEQQRQCMKKAFDLKSYDDVKASAAGIYARLSDKTMPADDSKPWPDEWIALFKRWIDEGCAP